MLVKYIALSQNMPPVLIVAADFAEAKEKLGNLKTIKELDNSEEIMLIFKEFDSPNPKGIFNCLIAVYPPEETTMEILLIQVSQGQVNRFVLDNCPVVIADPDTLYLMKMSFVNPEIILKKIS